MREAMGYAKNVMTWFELQNKCFINLKAFIMIIAIVFKFYFHRCMKSVSLTSSFND